MSARPEHRLYSYPTHVRDVNKTLAPNEYSIKGRISMNMTHESCMLTWHSNFVCLWLKSNLLLGHPTHEIDQGDNDKLPPYDFSLHTFAVEYCHAESTMT